MTTYIYMKFTQFIYYFICFCSQCLSYVGPQAPSKTPKNKRKYEKEILRYMRVHQISYICVFIEQVFLLVGLCLLLVGPIFQLDGPIIGARLVLLDRFLDKCYISQPNSMLCLGQPRTKPDTFQCGVHIKPQDLQRIQATPQT